MADGASQRPNQRNPVDQEVQFTLEELQSSAAKLYGLGHTRAQIARLLIDYLTPHSTRPWDQRLSAARTKLKRWEMQQSFRDLVWDQAVVKLDMSTPNILAGLGRKARTGRVDAAKLALELTGRYTPQGQSQPTQVAVIFQGIPRPGDEEVVELNGPEERVEARKVRRGAIGRARRDNT